MCVKDLSKQIFSEDYSIFCSPEQRDVVKDVLREIGYKVQRSAKLKKDGTFKVGWDENRVKEASWGYNDAQQMVILEHSAPTYTIVPFWQEGKYSDSEWKALFPRTKK